MAAKSMGAFEILAAIDLRAGRVVRLRKGDFEHETAYSDDPRAAAVALVGQGTRWLHVVDLDGARKGQRVQGEGIAAVIAAAGVAAMVEVGGGIRDLAAARTVIDLGAARIVLGTAALGSAVLVAQLVDELGPERVAIALDTRAGRVVGDAWQLGGRSADLEVTLAVLEDAGAQAFEVTAIDRDGTLAGPDLDLLRRVRDAAPDADVMAAGGIRSIEDLQAVRALGCAGAIVGRAIYEGTLNIAEAVAALA